MIIGLLRNYKQPQIADRVAAMNAKEFNCEPIFFSITDVDFNEKIIYCKRLVNGKWKDGTSVFPNIVYNDLPPAKKANLSLYKKLEEEGIPFTTHRLGINKSSYSDLFGQEEGISKYFLKTTNVESVLAVHKFLDEFKSVALKPNRGHKGLGVKILTVLKNNSFQVEDHDGKKKIYNEENFNNFLETELQKNKFHLQPKVTSETVNKHPFIIRTYIGRGINANWYNIFEYAAVDMYGSSVVNLNRGASISYLKDFLRLNYPTKAIEIEQELQQISKKVTELIQKKYEFLIDALGFDYGIDSNGEIKIFEINTFPGKRPFEAKAEYNMMQFAVYLGKKVMLGSE